MNILNYDKSNGMINRVLNKYLGLNNKKIKTIKSGIYIGRCVLREKEMDLRT